jgi:hypothetical protein
MKTLTSIIVAIAFIGSVCIAAPTNNTKAIKKYRAEYTNLFVKWDKSTDTVKRQQIQAQIEALKAKNLHLFVK